MSRPLKVVCATGNGTASAFAPELFERLGVEVVGLHTTLDHSFPHYNPNPEAMEMLHDMAREVRETGADLAMGFDGDGDRCGVVDDKGDEIFADKMGVIMARDMAALHPNARFVVDVKSTGLYATDPELARLGARTEYWKTGHSHMKRRVKETGALSGFERSGHYFLAPPIGRGYDCGLRVAVEICKLMDRNPDKTLSDLSASLAKTWITPTLAPPCPDSEKYGVVERLVARVQAMKANAQPLAGHQITDIVTVNGARIILEGGAWGLIRASSNTPNLVVVCESPESDADMRAVLAAIDTIVRSEDSVEDYDINF